MSFIGEIKMTRWLLAFSLLAFATASAYADDASKSSASSTAAFDKADQNHDGKLTREEFDAAVKNAGGPKSSSSATGSSTSSSSSWDFSSADKDHDGHVSRQEWDDMTKGGSSSSAASRSK